MEYIKIVWKDENQIKIAKGILVSEDEDFITVGADNGANISVSKRVIISIKRYKNE
ncbi:MAG: hypothetical protein KKH52_04560 [Nanoarchaeota archaeon]|nr:hypothetical protein [Nanoarchaeota archaeon]MBU1974638.1 hypothetical protein [Nanoarchaeota archaeon]